MATRVIIYSGKGGTGKTTISAATASLIAARGKRTLIMSSDPAHSLSDVIGKAISRDSLTPLAPNLYGLEVDTIYEMKKNVSGFQKFVANQYEGNGVGSSVSAELANQPGMDEILSLNRLLLEYKSGRWDCIVVDTAPTGNTLRLLAYPEMIVGGSSGRNFMKVYRGFSSVMRPFKKESTQDDFYKEVNRLLDMMASLSSFIVSADVSIRLVLNPEKLPVEETKRAYTFLSLYGIRLDAVVLNKILPTDSELGAYFDYWTQLQAKYIAETEGCFAPMPIFKSVLEGDEPIGVTRLTTIGERLFKETDPLAVLFNKQTIWVEDVGPARKLVGGGAADSGKEDKRPPTAMHRRLCVNLPFLEERDEILVERAGTDVQVTAGRLQRSVSLPRILLDAELTDFNYVDGILKIDFVDGVPEEDEEVLWEDDPFFANNRVTSGTLSEHKTN